MSHIIVTKDKKIGVTSGATNKKSPGNVNHKTNATNAPRSGSGKKNTKSEKPKEQKIEEQAVKYVSNMLHPVQAKKLDRPISCLSHPKLCTGQVIWDSSAIYQEVIISPDPFNFLTVIRDPGSTGTVVLGNGVVEDFAPLNVNAPQATLLNASTVNWSMQKPLPLGEGISLEATLVEGVAAFSGSMFLAFPTSEMAENQGSVFGYPLSAPAATTYTMGFRNKTSTTQVVSAFIGRINIATRAYTEVLAGTAVNAIQNSLTDCNVTIASANTLVPGDLMVIGVRHILSGNHAVNDFGIEFVSVNKSLTTAANNTVEVFSIGDAVYGKTSQEGAQLDALFTECNLWSPIALSSLFNVDQLLKDAGGRFQVAFLPSFIQEKLPNNLEDTWNTIAGLARSYPVAETQFVHGAHGSWVGQRIQDYEWRKPFVRAKVRNYDASSLPIVHFISRQVSNTSFKYYLSFHACFEVQTTDPRIDMTWGSGPSHLMPQLMSLFARHGDELVGHNPDHFARIKSLAKKAWADPTIRNMLMTALKASPSLLALL